MRLAMEVDGGNVWEDEQSQRITRRCKAMGVFVDVCCIMGVTGIIDIKTKKCVGLAGGISADYDMVERALDKIELERKGVS